MHFINFLHKGPAVKSSRCNVQLDKLAVRDYYNYSFMLHI